MQSDSGECWELYKAPVECCELYKATVESVGCRAKRVGSWLPCKATVESVVS